MSVSVGARPLPADGAGSGEARPRAHSRSGDVAHQFSDGRGCEVRQGGGRSARGSGRGC